MLLCVQTMETERTYNMEILYTTNTKGHIHYVKGYLPTN